MLILGYYFIRANISYPKSNIDESAFAAYQKQLDEKFGEKPSNQGSGYSSYNAQEKRIALRDFNPNSDNLEELIAKGVSPRIAKNIVNYRSKVGAFRSKEELLKLYAVSENLYATLEPFIIIPNEYTTESQPAIIKNKEIQLAIIDVNSASLDELKKIPGIADVLGQRILKYRGTLGGYYSLNQLEEIYGMPDELFANLNKYLKVDASKINKLKINSADFKVILKHPYLDYQDTKAIVNYIEQHGAITSLSEFKNLHVLQGKNVDRILPYLDLN